MAKQAGVMQVEGTVGNMTFFKTKDGYQARLKSGISAQRIKTDPKFARTRENMAEFGRAGSAGKLLRTAMATAVQQVKDSNMVPRLAAEMLRAVRADATSTRGLRNVLDGELELLQGFEFNAASPLTTTLFAPFITTIDRAAGTLKASFAPYQPSALISAPGGATHYSIMLAGAEIDFTNNVYVSGVNTSAVLPLDTNPTVQLDLSVNVTAASTVPLFLAVGITFLQSVNGKEYALNNGAFNALSLVKVLGL